MRVLSSVVEDPFSAELGPLLLSDRSAEARLASGPDRQTGDLRIPPEPLVSVNEISGIGMERQPGCEKKMLNGRELRW